MEHNHTLTVELGDRSYPIFIGSGLLSQPELLCRYVKGGTALIVSNTTIAPLYIEQIKTNLDSQNIQHDCVILEDGEQFKTLEAVQTIITTLLEKKHNRQTTLIALGGGVVGDITGFAASVYQRGVNFIQIPTTTLSQVDSSVGGKTGVNHILGKNMIGAFHQPQCVIADISTLSTLPNREFSAGLAEIIKYGLIHDAKFFKWLEQNISKLMARDSDIIAQAILVSCQTKANIVSIDERESGIRAILNLGHTFGHAIEATMGYGNWLHGEAVAAGMVMAVDLSCRQQWIDNSLKQRTIDLLKNANLPVTSPTNMTVDQYMSAMSIDKKVINGTIQFILLKGLGEAIVTSDYNPDFLKATLTNS
jgi:3-dehydroquinate synthase|tara:strand:- start:8409 stop:9497 length:1089 start_codon:yes stop_codon:yes gene_type:complete